MAEAYGNSPAPIALGHDDGPTVLFEPGVMIAGHQRAGKSLAMAALAQAGLGISGHNAPLGIELVAVDEEREQQRRIEQLNAAWAASTTVKVHRHSREIERRQRQEARKAAKARA